MFRIGIHVLIVAQSKSGQMLYFKVYPNIKHKSSSHPEEHSSSALLLDHHLDLAGSSLNL